AVASRPPSRYQSRPHECAPVPARPVRRRGRGGASVDLPHAASAGAAGPRAPRRARRRQGGGIDDRGGGTPLSRHVQARARPPRLAGLAVTRHGYARPTRLLPVIEAGHPVPDQASLDGAARALALADAATQDDLVLVLMSGGASANWIAPAAGLALAEKQAV